MADKPKHKDIATRWWEDLQPKDKHPDPSRRSGDRAALARLRRCATVTEAASESEALVLARAVGASPRQPERLENALLAAMVLAHVRENYKTERVARSLGAPSAEQRARMSPLRLSRLLTAETTEERLIAFRRVVGLLDGKAHVPDLADALLDWSEKTRIAWAFDYYNVPKPDQDDPLTPEKPAAGDAA